MAKDASHYTCFVIMIDVPIMKDLVLSFTNGAETVLFKEHFLIRLKSKTVLSQLSFSFCLPINLPVFVRVFLSASPLRFCGFDKVLGRSFVTLPITLPSLFCDHEAFLLLFLFFGGTIHPVLPFLKYLLARSRTTGLRCLPTT